MQNNCKKTTVVSTAESYIGKLMLSLSNRNSWEIRHTTARMQHITETDTTSPSIPPLHRYAEPIITSHIPSKRSPSSNQMTSTTYRFLTFHRTASTVRPAAPRPPNSIPPSTLSHSPPSCLSVPGLSAPSPRVPRLSSSCTRSALP